MIRARCQKSIRRAARARIFASESWTRQYKRARGGWQFYALMALACTFLPLFAFIGLIGLPVFGGLQIAQGDDGIKELIGFVIAMISAVVSLGHAGWIVHELLSSRSLAVVSQLPMSDQKFLTNRIRFAMRTTLAFLLISLSFFVAAAFAFRVDGRTMAMIIGLAPLQWGIVAAFSLIIPAWVPRVARTEAVGGIVSLSIMVVITCVTLAQMNVVQIESIRLAALTVLPTGWVFLLLEFGIIEQLPVVAWLFLPIGLTLVAGVVACGRLQARYRPWEITLNSESFAQVSFAPPDPAELDPAELDAAEEESAEAEVETSDEGDWRKRFRSFMRDWVGLAPEKKEVELKPGDAADVVRSRGFLEPYSWPQGGLVERMVGSILTEREQRVAELMACGEPEWSRRMLMDMGLGCLGLAVLAMAQQLFGMKILMMSWHVGMFVLFVGLRRSWPGMALRCSTGHVASLMGLVPITHRELNRAVMVLGAVRALMYAPFAVAVSVTGVAGMNGGFNWLQALYIASKAVLAVVAIHQWWFIGLQPHQSSKSILAQIGEGLLFIPIMIMALGGAGGMVGAGQSEIWSMAGAAVMFGSGWVAQRWQRRRVLSGPIDFITMRANEMQQQIQAQQRREPTASW
ncbi:MAG: hypothetical protein H8E37_13360 [Planctomycetes bacterium]|nr:hypothetical protein [Planctomycetota bacterium]